jgi:hypothetical protein
MSRNIDDIEQYSSVSTPDGRVIKRFQRIYFEPSPIGKGSFGKVYRVESIDDDVPEVPMLLKLIPITKDDIAGTQSLKTISLLHEKMRRDEAKHQRPFLQGYPEMIGVPLVSFAGKDAVKEQRFSCFLMYDLTELNYRDLGDQSNTIRVADDANILDRMYLSYQLFRSLDWMHRNDFNNADLSIKSLFLNDKQLRLGLIDYDGGYHFKQQKAPLSLGKLGDWASYTFNMIRTVAGFRPELSILDRIHDEYFIAASAFFELLYGVPPFFFLNSKEETVKKEYLSNNKWPELDFNASYANKTSRTAYDHIFGNLRELEASGLSEIVNGFKTVFGKSYYDGKYRFTPARWKRLIKKVLDEVKYDPLVKEFSSNRAEIMSATDTICIKWDIARADQIKLNGTFLNFAVSSQSFTPGDDTTYTLDALNDFGKTSLEVEVLARKIDPEISYFSADNILRNSLTPVILSWDTEHTDHIYLNGKQLDNQGTYSVEPTQETTYSLVAVGHFDQRVEKTLTVSVVAPVIKRFDYEVNLEHGIKNVDLRFDVTDCESLSISPRIGVVDPTGNLVSILIDERTEFTLTARGLFQDTVERVTAIPFPIPSVLQLSPPHPTIEIHTQLNPEVLQPNLQLLAPELKLPLLETLGTMIDIDPAILDEAIRVPDFTSLQLKPKEEAVRTLSFAEAMSSFKSVYQKHLEKND